MGKKTMVAAPEKIKEHDMCVGNNEKHLRSKMSKG
jgi:hypothetical protein